MSINIADYIIQHDYLLCVENYSWDLAQYEHKYYQTSLFIIHRFKNKAKKVQKKIIKNRPPNNKGKIHF